jgi:hypothetical protein
MARTQEKVELRENVARAEVDADPDGLWSIAMLRIAMELKRPGSASVEEIIDGVVERMGIQKEQFEKYLQDNFGLLEDAVRRGGYVP